MTYPSYRTYFAKQKASHLNGSPFSVFADPIYLAGFLGSFSSLVAAL